MSRSRLPSLLFLAIALLCLFGIASVEAKKKKKNKGRKNIKGQLTASCPNLVIEDCAAYEDDCLSCGQCAAGYALTTDKMECCDNANGCLDYASKTCDCVACSSGNKLVNGKCIPCPTIKNCENGAYTADCKCNWCNWWNSLNDDGTCTDCAIIPGCKEYNKDCTCNSS